MREFFLSLLFVGSLFGGVCQAVTNDKAQQLSRAIHLRTSALLKEKLDNDLRQRIELLLDGETKTLTQPAGEGEDLFFSDSSGKRTPCLEPPLK